MVVCLFGGWFLGCEWICVSGCGCLFCGCDQLLGVCVWGFWDVGWFFRFSLVCWRSSGFLAAFLAGGKALRSRAGLLKLVLGLAVLEEF